MSNQRGSVPCGARILGQPGSVGRMNEDPGVTVHAVGKVPGNQITATAGAS